MDNGKMVLNMEKELTLIRTKTLTPDGGNSVRRKERELTVMPRQE